MPAPFENYKNMNDDLWVVNPDTDNVVLSAKSYTEAIRIAEEEYSVKKIDWIGDFYSFYMKSSLWRILTRIAEDIAPDKRKQDQWQVNIHKYSEQLHLNCTLKSKYRSAKAAILNCIADVFGLSIKSDLYQPMILLEDIFVSGVKKIDKKNPNDYKFEDTLFALEQLGQYYRALNENYKHKSQDWITPIQKTE